MTTQEKKALRERRQIVREVMRTVLGNHSVSLNFARDQPGSLVAMCVAIADELLSQTAAPQESK